MKTLALHDQFFSWLLSTYNDPDFSERVHCFSVRKRVALMEGELVDFVSLRHDLAASPEGKGIFSVGLWKFNVGAIDLDGVDEMCRHLQAFRSGCAEVLNQLELKGELGHHPVGVHGNLVGAAVASGTLLPLLANGFGDLSFWTYRDGVNRIEVEPYYDESLTQKQTRLFRKLLEPGACAGERMKRKQARAVLPV